MINFTKSKIQTLTDRLLPISDEGASQLSNDVYNNSLRSECGVDAPAFLSAVYKNSTQAKKRQADAPQYGRSMIEMLGVLAIIGVMSVGGIAGYSKAMQKYKTNSTTETMIKIASNIKTLTLRMKDYTGIKAAAIKMKAIPPELVSSGSTLKPNAFGGTIEIDAVGTRSFYVAMNGLPRDVCVDIATKDFGDAAVVAMDEDFTIPDGWDGKNLKTEAAGCGSNYCIKKIMSPATAAAACSSDSNTNSVALIMF